MRTWKQVMSKVPFREINSNSCDFQTGNIWVLFDVNEVMFLGPSIHDFKDEKAKLSGNLYMKDFGKLDDFS